METDIPNELRTYLRSLIFLSLIKPNEKIDTINFKLDDNTQWTTCIKRYLKGENRDRTVSFIDNIAMNADKMIKSYGTGKYGEMLRESIMKAIQGIVNIIETYKNDTGTVAKLQVSINILERCNR